MEVSLLWLWHQKKTTKCLVQKSQQIIQNEGFIKHETNITSNKFIGSINADFNATKVFNLYAEAGTNGDEIAYGIGTRISFGALHIYIPLITEKGFEKFNNMGFIKYSIKLDLSQLMSLGL